MQSPAVFRRIHSLGQPIQFLTCRLPMWTLVDLFLRVFAHLQHLYFSRAKSAEPIDMPLSCGLVDSGWPKEPCIR